VQWTKQEACQIRDIPNPLLLLDILDRPNVAGNSVRIISMQTLGAALFFITTGRDATPPVSRAGKQ
jgi:hypothetical protein